MGCRTHFARNFVWILFVSLAIGLTACGKKEKKDEGDKGNKEKIAACQAEGKKWSETKSECVEECDAETEVDDGALTCKPKEAPAPTCEAGQVPDENGECKPEEQGEQATKESCHGNEQPWDPAEKKCLSKCGDGKKFDATLNDGNGGCKDEENTNARKPKGTKTAAECSKAKRKFVGKKGKKGSCGTCLTGFIKASGDTKNVKACVKNGAASNTSLSKKMKDDIKGCREKFKLWKIKGKKVECAKNPCVAPKAPNPDGSKCVINQVGCERKRLPWDGKACKKTACKSNQKIDKDPKNKGATKCVKKTTGGNDNRRSTQTGAPNGGRKQSAAATGKTEAQCAKQGRKHDSAGKKCKDECIKADQALAANAGQNASCAFTEKSCNEKNKPFENKVCKQACNTGFKAVKEKCEATSPDAPKEEGNELAQKFVKKAAEAKTHEVIKSASKPNLILGPVDTKKAEELNEAKFKENASDSSKAWLANAFVSIPEFSLTLAKQEILGRGDKVLVVFKTMETDAGRLKVSEKAKWVPMELKEKDDHVAKAIQLQAGCLNSLCTEIGFIGAVKLGDEKKAVAIKCSASYKNKLNEVKKASEIELAVGSDCELLPKNDAAAATGQEETDADTGEQMTPAQLQKLMASGA